MKTRYSNGLGIAVLSAIMAVTPLIPAAMSAPTPHWVWDEDGKVHDANGNYRTLTDDEACVMYGLCKRLQPELVSSTGSGTGDGGGGGDSGGCR